MRRGGKIDLHVHTTASDGVLTPAQVVQRALLNGVRLLAIADHDSTNGIGDAVCAARGTPLTVWPAIELSTDLPRGELHILGYFVRRSCRPLQSLLRRLRDNREQRAREMVAKLSELGMQVPWQRVDELASGGTVGRPHLAQAMLERSYVGSQAEAFEQYIGRNGPAYVERFKLTPEEAVGVIREVGGLPVWAHPVVSPGRERGEQTDLLELLPGLVYAGLGGIETRYPGYDEDTINWLEQVTRQWGLVATGGTDFHDPDTSPCDIGDIEVPWEAALTLRAARRDST